MDNIGAIGVEVQVDTSKLGPGIQSAVSQATTGGNAIAGAFTNASVKTQQLQLSVDTLKQKYQQLAQQIAQSGAGGAEQYQALENAARRVEIANQKLALSIKTVGESGATGVKGATEAIAEVGHAAEVSGQQATSAFIRVTEGSSALRAVENFIAKTLHAGPALQALFPIVGAVAFGEIIAKIAGHITEFFEHSAQGVERVDGEFRKLINDTESEVDHIQVANDKLDIQIAKLTGTHQNTLKLMIDEAAVSVDKLADKLDSALGKLAGLIKKENIGVIEALLTGQGVTNPGAIPGVSIFTPTGKKQPGLDEILAGKSGVGGELQRIDEIKDRANIEIRAASAVGDLKRANLAIDRAAFDLTVQYGVLLQRTGDELAKLNRLSASGFDETKNIEVAKKSLRELTAERDLALKSIENIGKQQQVTQLGPGKNLAEEWLKQQQELLAQKKAQDEITITQERAFWSERLPIAIAGGEAYKQARRTIENDIGSLTQQIIRQRRTADAHELAAQEKDFADQIKSATAGTLPHTAALEFVQSKLAAPTIDEGAYKEAMKQLPKLTEDATKESEEFMKRWVKDSEEIFAEGGRRTAAQTSADAAAMIATLQALGGMEDEIAAQQKRKRSADRQVTSETQKFTDIDAAGTASQKEAEAQREKIKLQGQYDSILFPSLRQHLQSILAISAAEEQVLIAKRDQALAEFNAATEAGDVVKAAQESVKWLHEDDAISTHRLQTEQQIAKTKRDANAGVQLARGLNQNIDQVGNSLAQSFGNAVVNTGKVGSVFKDALKNLEVGAISTIFGTAIKQAVAASGIEHLIGAALSKVFGAPKDTETKVLASVTRRQVGATDQLTTATEQLTGAIRSLASQITPNTEAITQDTAATTADIGSTSANTGALIPNTAATAANTVALYVSAATGLLGSLFGGLGGLFGGGGGAGGGGEAVSSSISFGGEAVPGAAGGGRINGLTLVGENGPELFNPGSAGTIIPADQTRALLSGGLTDAPGVPSSAFSAGGGSSDYANANTTNQTIGNIGNAHFHIYGEDKPRQVARQLSDFLKRSYPTGSPLNQRA